MTQDDIRRAAAMDTPEAQGPAPPPVNQALSASIAAAAQILETLPATTPPNPPTQQQARAVIHSLSPEAANLTSAQRQQYGIEGITDSIDTVRSLSLAPRTAGRNTIQGSIDLGGELPRDNGNRGGELRDMQEVVRETQQSYDTDEMLQPTQPDLYTRATIGRTPIPFGLTTEAIDLRPESPDSIPLTSSRDARGNIHPPPGFQNLGTTTSRDPTNILYNANC
jgi:hypothetical protein